MTITVFEPGQLLAGVAATAVPVPIGDPISMVRSASHAGASPMGKSGAWECSPGTWRRQVILAEFCYFLEGDAIFEPDDGEPIRISAGQAAYFPANSLGTWQILTPSRKVFVLFEEAEGR
jgi:uncharacterized cupin superfamily protein